MNSDGYGYHYDPVRVASPGVPDECYGLTDILVPHLRSERVMGFISEVDVGCSQYSLSLIGS